ncbi:ABC transporter permease [Naumannella huperziae]
MTDRDRGTATAAVAQEAPTRTRAWRLLAGNPVTAASVVVLVLIVGLTVIGPFVLPYGLNDVDVPNALRPPSAAHWFGTDELGRDIATRVIIAGRASLEVAIVSVAIATIAGVLIGLVSGYVGGVLDVILMRLVDVMFAFPVMLLALAIVAILAPSKATTMIAIGIVYIPIFARITRASVLSVRQETFVQVSRTMGSPWWRILLRRVLPNVTGPIIVQVSLSLAFAILSEAALSFLGLGIQPPNPSWGGMLADAQNFLGQAWWMGVFPGAAVLVTALAFNLVGDGLRDVLDPKQRTLMETRRQR